MHNDDLSDRNILFKLQWGFGGWGFWVNEFHPSYLLKEVPSDQSVSSHNFIISQDPSLTNCRIAASMPELHESEGDSQKRARSIEMLK